MSSGGGDLRERCLGGVERGEEQEEAEGHDKNVGLIARHAHGTQAFASFAVAQLPIYVLKLLHLM